jgi:multidrug efflux pump subunit AcrA (membrane-fusion protein)
VTRILAGAAAIALALAIGTALWFRAEAASAARERDEARAALSVALAANASLEAALARARAQAEINDRVMLGLAAELARINASIADNTAALAALEDSNEDVRTYLGSLVPGALELQLNR